MFEREYTGSQALLRCLEANEVQTIFGYPGGVLLGLYDEIYANRNIRHILVRHEQGGVHAADGYARVAQKAGVVLATSGPGATNLLTGLCSAQMDSIPIVALTGQVPTSVIGKDAFQEADLFNLSMPVTKHNYQIRDNADIPRIVNEAFAISTHGRPGPVAVDLPKDMLNGKFAWDEMLPEPSLPALADVPLPVRDKLLRAAEMILEAQRPVLYVGGGVVHSEAGQDVAALAERCLIPLVWTLMGKGAVPDGHHLNLGMLGMHGTAAANYAIYESDLLIAVGVRFDDRATGKLASFAPEAKVIHIDIDPAEIGKNRKLKPGVDLSVVSDAKPAIRGILDLIDHRKGDTGPWLDKVRAWQQEYPLDDREVAGEITPQHIFRALNRVAADAIYTTDVGQHQMWAAQYIDCIHPHRWITSGGLGTMGFGLPAALGAKAAAQDLGLDRPVICVTGDGSFQMCAQELGTLVSHNLPVITVILNNDNLGMVRQWQELFYEGHYSYSHLREGSPDFAKLAESYGIRGVRMEKPEGLEDVLREAIDSGEPAVIDLRLHAEANVYPIVPAGTANHLAQGIQSPTVPEGRSYDDYMESVQRAPNHTTQKPNPTRTPQPNS